ncbi:MAG: hypothetical protein VX438_12430 [Planctomycetota bacterium]|jgi:hypothetical protein|nr:hypothetical protein [Planctomycetota bacterium]
MQKIKFLMLLSAGILSSFQAIHASDIKVETVVGGLNNPCGVAIHPKTGTLFVSDSGAGVVCRIDNGKAVPVITDFPIGEYGKGPKYSIGPLGLTFLSEDLLLVGGGGLADGEELLRLYKLPPAGKSIKASEMVSNKRLAPTDDLKGEGNFYALAISGDTVYVSSNGDDTKGWLGKATIKDGKISDFKRGIATKEAVEVDAPVGLTVDPKHGHIVVGQMGEITIPGDGLLSFYSAKDGKLLVNFETGLSDITSVAYDKESYQMYALDFSWHDTKQGGLFHLTKTPVKDGKSGCKCEKLIGLDKPTAMVIDKSGTAFITVIGTADGDKLGGKLVKIKLPAIE